MNKKFSLTDKSINVFGRTLFQIKAEVALNGVAKGELGGYVEKEENLSSDGNAWVFGNARVFGDALVSGDAWVSGNAQVSGNAWVSGNAQVSGDAWVSGDAQVYGDARVCARAKFTKGCFIGGDDSGKITDITDKTGSTYWKKQYVLGEYEITPIHDEVTPQSLSGKEVTVTVDGETFIAVIK